MNRKQHSVLVPAVLALVLSGSGRSEACGASARTQYPALTSPATAISYIVDTQVWSGGWDSLPKEEFRFLYPATQTRPTAMKLLWGFSYGFPDGASDPHAEGAGHVELTTGGLDIAIRAGDLRRADKAARRIIDEYLALPPGLAEKSEADLWRAVGVVELQAALNQRPLEQVSSALGETASESPALLDALRTCLNPESAQQRATPSPLRESDETALSPGSADWCRGRRASWEYFEVRRRTQREIPDGWREGSKQAAPAEALLALTEAWRSNHPAHPLVDLLTLWDVRLYHFAQRTNDIWRILLEIYPRRQARVLAELRYQLLTRDWPTFEQVIKIPYPEIEVGLLTQDLLTEHPKEWSRLWSRAEKQLPLPWAINLQERLLSALARLADKSPLPAWFPSKPAKHSPLWGKLRTGLLLAHNRNEEAEQQAALLPSDEEQAALLAAAHLRQGRSLDAVCVPKLDGNSRSLIVRGWLNDVALQNLLGHPVEALSQVARIELATRAMDQEQFGEAAALLDRQEPARAALFREAEQLRTSNRQLALARFFVTHAGELSHGLDTGDYRGQSDLIRGGAYQYTRLKDAIGRADERWLALRLFARWLDANPSHRTASSVLSEANAVYNRLLYWGGVAYFWADFAPRSPVAARLRAHGKRLRERRH